MEDLLHYLTDTLECSYLSDLHYVTVSFQHASKILNHPDCSFPLEDYQRVAEYLTGRVKRYYSCAQAKRALTRVLSDQTRVNMAFNPLSC